MEPSILKQMYCSVGIGAGFPYIFLIFYKKLSGRDLDKCRCDSAMAYMDCTFRFLMEPTPEAPPTNTMFCPARPLILSQPTALHF
jgi:hypothetical protein